MQLFKAKFDGVVEMEGLRAIKTTNSDGDAVEVVMGRTGEIRIVDPESGKTF